MKKIQHIITLIIALLFTVQFQAQVDFNAVPDDDLGNVSDDYKEYFFEALKQRGIENYSKANEALHKCINLNSSEAILYFELGKNYNNLKDYGAAEEALEKALSKSDENQWVLEELYEVYIKQNENEKAIKVLKKLTKTHPDYKEQLTQVYLRNKDYNSALDVLDEMDDEFGISSSRDKIRDRIYAITGKAKAQINNLKDRVENDQNSEESYLELIYRYSKNGEEKKAYETAKALLQSNPESELVHLALYKFYITDNKTDDAIASMKTVLNSEKINPEAKIKVMADFVKFVSQNPQYENTLLEVVTDISNEEKSGKLLVELGQYYLVKNDKVKALSHYEEAHKLEPENFGILRNLLLLYVDLEKYKDAETKSAQGLEKYPSQPVLYYVNAVSKNKLNAPENAIEQLEMGLDYIIDDPSMEADFYKQFSLAYTLLGKASKASSYLEKAKKLKQ